MDSMTREASMSSRSRGFAFVLAASLMMLAAPARASTVSSAPIPDPSGRQCSLQLNYQAAAGEFNQVHVSGSGATVPNPSIGPFCSADAQAIQITEVYAKIKAGPGCVQVSSKSVLCAVQPVGTPPSFSQSFWDLGDRDDLLSFPPGMPTSAQVQGGDGTDTIEVADGSSTSVGCGAGVDTVKADRFDQVASDCEQVQRF
jgi:hypothetical protein